MLSDVIKEFSCRNKDLRVQKVYSVTNSDGFVPSQDYFSKDVFSKDLSNNKIVRKGMLAYNPSRINVGSVACVQSEDEVIVCPLYVVVEVNEKKLLAEYLNLFLHSDIALEQIKSLTSGSVRDSLKYNDFTRLCFPLPSVETQQAVIEKLSAVKNLIAKREQQLSKLDQLAKSRFIEMFGDPIANPKSWTTGKLSEVTDKIGSGATPQGGKESYITSGISLIRSMNIHNGKFEYKDLAHITEEQAQQLNNVNVKSKDVFINITGASVARSCVVPDDVLPARVNQHVSIIRCKQNILNPIFANSLFISLPYQRTLLAIGESGGATRQAITKQQLENLMIILPSLELQNEFAAFIEQLDKSKVIIIKSAICLKILLITLLYMTFC